MNRLFLLTALCFAVGCSAPKPEAKSAVAPPKPRGEVGTKWKGEPQPGSNPANQDSPFLSEHLGGYRLELKPDGKFDASFRGLDETGTWKEADSTVSLTVLTVMGRSREQAAKESRSKGSAIDLSLFDKPVLLSRDPKAGTLTWKGEAGAQTVIFRKE